MGANTIYTSLILESVSRVYMRMYMYEFHAKVTCVTAVFQRRLDHQKVYNGHECEQCTRETGRRTGIDYSDIQGTTQNPSLYKNIELTSHMCWIQQQDIQAAYKRRLLLVWSLDENKRNSTIHS